MPARSRFAGAPADNVPPTRGSSVVRVRCERETAALAAAVATTLRPGDVVHLTGPVGAGKTTFVRHACAALGVTEPVTSPTFSIAHLYRTTSGQQVAHLDLYRARAVTVEELADLDPYLGEDTIVFVEWPEAGRGVLPPASVTIAIAPVALERSISVQRHG